MRKLWLTFTAMLFCSISAFAQPISISSEADFMKIGRDDAFPASSDYILMNNIVLGDLGELDKAIIPTYSGTFDGNGKTITYQANFQGTSGTIDYSLFGTVSGTIKNLNVNATNVSLAGSVNNMNVAVLCGSLTSSGIIEYCNASGHITSTVDASNNGGSDAGLIVGESKGTVRYCTGSGSVVGVGYAGGLIGQMTDGASVLACSFSGSVTAVTPDGVTLSLGLGSFAGGICGYASNSTQISFCVANGTITSGWVTSGIVSVVAGYSSGSASVKYTYADGELIVTEKGNLLQHTVTSNTTNSSNNNNTGNYSGNTSSSAQDVVTALETARTNAGHTGFYFEVINGEVVLVIGDKPITPTFVCEPPIGLTVSIVEGIFTANWSVEHQDDSYPNEQEFIISISGGEFGEDVTEEIIPGTSITIENIEETLPVSENPYVFTVKTKCNTVFSNALTYTFYVNENCSSINALQASNVTSTSANITWDGDADEVKLNGVAEEFTNGQTLALTNLTPGLSYIVEAIVYCTVEGETDTLTTSVNFKTHGVGYETKQTGNFNDPNTWLDNSAPQGDIANIRINTGHIVTVDHNLKITDDYKIVENNGVLKIQQGQLINYSNVNVPGIVEIVTPQEKKKNSWTFIGAPFGGNEGYQLGTIYPMSNDISVSKYNYSTANWSESWETVETVMEAGEGYFAWPFYDGAVIFTTYGDVWADEVEGNDYDFNREPKTVTNLNNADEITITKNNLQGNANTGRWMALANPYPAKLSVSLFVQENPSKLQGNCVYVFRNGTFDMKANQSGTQGLSNGDIEMTEGFFVNLASGNDSVKFSKTQLTDYPQAKSQVAPREFVELSLVKGNHESKLYFAHNQEAEQNYDIFDANKMFAPTEIAEPYFVTDGIALVKEEVAELPYYATMNVRSFADDTVSFVVNNIPEGLAVSIIDGENIIDMIEGGVYTTEILTGENADRFKVLIKKNVGIADVEELEVNITNNNRHISIATTETDLQVEVYNALGQKVLSTKDRNFTLNQVSAGAYLIKAFNNKASKTQKIVVE